MKIDLNVFIVASFEIITSNGEFHNTSKSIARLLNIPVETYNQLLIDKVIKHKFFKLHSHGAGVCADLTFDLKCLSKEDYLQRFKDTFSEQLTLLTLGGM